MKKKGAIFDFNGTMVFDGETARRTWPETFQKIKRETGKDFDSDKMMKSLIGVPGDNFGAFRKVYEIIGAPYTEEDVLACVQYKQEVYRQTVIEMDIPLADGLEELLNELQAKHIPVNIATASIPENIDFYFERYDLSRWFKRENILEQDASFVNKAPMYIGSAAKIGLEMKDCVLFDDRPDTIKDAISAGCDYVVKVNTRGEADDPEIRQRILTYRDFDREVFE